MKQDVKEALDRLANMLIETFNKNEGPIVELDMSSLWDDHSFNSITGNHEMMDYLNVVLKEQGLIVGVNVLGQKHLAITSLELLEEHGTADSSMSLEDFEKLVETCGGDEKAARDILVEMALNKSRQ